jgi:hypothetical protein
LGVYVDMEEEKIKKSLFNVKAPGFRQQRVLGLK